VPDPSFLTLPGRAALAYRLQPGRSPTVVFLPGFKSDMNGDKAEHLAAWCAARGNGFLRFDYAGHGASGGEFTTGTVGGWRDDALALIDRVTDGALLLVGSSMGGWIALLAALARPGRVAGLIGIAAAPDFTEALMWEAMTPGERAILTQDGVLNVPSDYGAPLPITRGLIEDGRRHLLLGGPIALDCPVRLMHGQQDADVPWERSLLLAGRLTSSDVRTVLIKDAGHRLSRPGDLRVLDGLLAELLGGEDGGQAFAVGGVGPVSG
jgi:pimeloyl-ACP methyl ester carboxylesterase